MSEETNTENVKHSVTLSLAGIYNALGRPWLVGMLRGIGHDLPEGTRIRTYTEEDRSSVRIEWETSPKVKP